MAIKIQLRRGTAAEWTSANPVLMQGEMGVETDTLKVKIGNGTSAWTTLPYFTQGAKGDKGDQGIQGIQGVQGNTGPVGPVGPANSLSVGSVTTGIEGSDAEVTITGTAPNQTMSLVIPRGDKGDAATITVGTVTQVAAGQPATVTNSGTSAAAVLNFEIPNAVGVPTGGTAGQIVRKTASGTEWADMPPSQLSGQTDVSISSPQNKQVLKYDGSKWVNATASGGVTVSESSPADPSNGDGWFFAADGTQFVRYDDGTSVQWVQPNAVLSSQIEQRYFSPNYLINGGFDIWQRGTSVSTGGGGTTNYMADRWRFGNNNAASQYTASRVTNASDAPTAFALRITSARVDVNLNGLEQVMEYQDVTRLRGKQLTLSFWVRASGSQSFTSSVQTGTLTTDVYPGTGNAMTGQATIGSLTVNASTSWQRVSLTTTAVSASAGQLRVSLMESVSIANGSWVEFAGVQLEDGVIPTTFRRNANSLQGELAACQRYFYRHTGGGGFATLALAQCYTGTQATAAVSFPVSMRIAPSASFSAASTFTLSTAGFGTATCTGATAGAYSSLTYARCDFTVGSSVFTAGHASHLMSTSGTAFIDFNAEL